VLKNSWTASIIYHTEEKNTKTSAFASKTQRTSHHMAPAILTPHRATAPNSKHTQATKVTHRCRRRDSTGAKVHQNGRSSSRI